MNRAKATAVKAGARISEHGLTNGMRVLLAERHLDPVVAVMLFFRVGSRNETESEAGVSHFLEHMMFKGSSSFGKGEVDLLTTTLGGSNNAFTGMDHTAYWFEFASDRWERALEIESDRMRNLQLDAQEFESEKAVVLEELSMGKDDPWRTLSEEVQMILFPRHPYRRPVIGYRDVVRSMSVDTMRDYYRRFYHPANATLVVCGDFKPERALELIDKHFGSIEAGPAYAEVDRARPPIEEPKGQRRIQIRWDDQSTRLCMAWPTVSVGTDEDYALDLAVTLLTGGRMARLTRKLVLERGLATSLSTYNDTHVDLGSFWLYAEVAQGVRIEELESAIDEELEELASQAVPAAELRRAKAILRASEAYESETVSDLAEDLGEYAVDAHWQLAVEGVERSERIRAVQIRDCVRRYLRPERRVVGRCLPAESNGAQ